MEIPYIASKKDSGKIIPRIDGLITNKKNIFLSITIADCLPIFLYDPVKEVVGLVHAGWRGLEKHIIKNTIDAFINTFTSIPANILVAIGTGIGVEHFEVQQNLLEVFKDYPDAVKQREEKHFINLKEIAKKQLLALRVLESNIEVSPSCTYCEKDTYFSHRRGHMCPEEVMMAIIGRS